MSKKTILIIIILIIAVGAVGYVLLSKSKPCAMLYVGYKNTETGQCETFSGCSVPKKYILDEVCVNQVLEKEMPGIVGECKFSEENCKNGKTEFCNQTITKFPGTEYEKKFVCSEIFQDNTGTTVFEFNKPFAVSGKNLPGGNFAPLYTSDKILEKSLVTIRARDFWSNACDRGGNTPDCPFKNEQMVRLETSVAESEGASWNVKEIYLTDKSRKIQQYEGYQLEVLSIDSVNKQATIVIRKVQ